MANGRYSLDRSLKKGTSPPPSLSPFPGNTYQSSFWLQRRERQVPREKLTHCRVDCNSVQCDSPVTLCPASAFCFGKAASGPALPPLTPPSFSLSLFLPSLPLSSFSHPGIPPQCLLLLSLFLAAFARSFPANSFALCGLISSPRLCKFTSAIYLSLFPLRS